MATAPTATRAVVSRALKLISEGALDVGDVEALAAHVGLGSPNLARLHQSLTGQPTGAVSPSVSVVKAFAQTTFTLSDGKLEQYQVAATE